MHVVLLGAGALGSVYGARLAGAGSSVEVVGRAAEERARRRLERVGEGTASEWEIGRVHETASDAADAILVCVPYPALDAAAERVGGGGAPIVVLTPMLPRDHARLASRFPGRLVAAMPSVVAYRNPSGVVRYWLPRGVTTYIERRGAGGAAEEELVRTLQRAGVAARLEADVLSRNIATTVSFLPLAMAIDAAGGVDAALKDGELRALALEATAESSELGRALGKPESWAGVLLRFVGPLALRAGVAMARSRFPEALAYVDEHFGRKLHEQNVRMGSGIVDLAREKGMRRSALERLLDRLTRVPRP